MVLYDHHFGIGSWPSCLRQYPAKAGHKWIQPAWSGQARASARRWRYFLLSFLSFYLPNSTEAGSSCSWIRCDMSDKLAFDVGVINVIPALLGQITRFPASTFRYARVSCGAQWTDTSYWHPRDQQDQEQCLPVCVGPGHGPDLAAFTSAPESAPPNPVPQLPTSRGFVVRASWRLLPRRFGTRCQ